MNWADTKEQEEFRIAVQSFIKDRLPDYYVEKSKDPAGTDLQPDENGIQYHEDWQHDMALGSDEAKKGAKEWAEALAENGWSAPHWPKEYGGGGLSSMEQFIFKQELALNGAPLVGGSGVAMLGPTLIHHGTEEQKKEFLPKTLNGDILWAQGYSEPGAGSDLASLQTRAVKDGDNYVVNGQKIWTSQGHKATWFFMLVRTDSEAPKHRGISFLLADTRENGVEVRPLISGGWQHATNESFYTDVKIPIAQRVGEENRGWYVGMTLLDYERSNIAGAVELKKEIEGLINFLNTDEGKQKSTIADRESVKGKIVDRFIEAEVLSNFSLRIISIQAADQVPNYEASTSKVFYTTLLQQLQQTGMKAFGLYSQIWDSLSKWAPMNARFTQNSMHFAARTISGGSNEIQRNIIATRGLGLPRG
ncbi:MAG: acyl-CoA dehydrogenase family protein [Dehalococcoidia bacterium]